MSETMENIRKQTYNERLERTGYFCEICNTETRNADGLVTFHSEKTVQALNICHDCLPEGFE